MKQIIKKNTYIFLITPNQIYVRCFNFVTKKMFKKRTSLTSTEVASQVLARIRQKSPSFQAKKSNAGTASQTMISI